MGYHPGWFADGMPLLVFRDKLCSRSGSDPFLKWVYLRPVAIIVIITKDTLCARDRCNPSWPIIKGRITMPDEELIGVWPCNHLGFSYGDITPELAEIAHRLNIGYTIYDGEGRKYQKST